MFSTGVHQKLLGPKKYSNGFLGKLAKEAVITLAKSAGKFAVDKSLDFRRQLCSR
jgi:hypothetical protein